MVSERGEMGLRLLVAMALVAMLIWLVPILFLDRGGRAAGPASETGPAPAANDPDDSGGSASGAGGNPIDRANELSAQTTLTAAIAGAQIYVAENGTFDGYGPDPASSIDPAVTYTTGAPAVGTVTLRVMPASVVMVTLVEGGQPLCAGVAAGVVTKGRTDASTAEQCSGGWG
jgi:hypothetical protein